MTASFWQEVESRRRPWDVLGHPFYARWVEGGLSPRALAVYASEYEHAVVAIAEASARAAGFEGSAEMSHHASEENDHVHVWRAFAKATGWGGAGAWAYGEDPLPATVDCAQAWAGNGERRFAEHLVTLYAIESVQAKISAVKLDGLLRHYGFEAGPATEYFRLHAELDGEHARLMRERLDSVMGTVQQERLLDQAEAVHRSYWAMLDGVEELAAG